MEVIICIGIILIIIKLIIFWLTRKSQVNEEIDSYIPSTPVSHTSTVQENARWFTLAELNQAEDGKYSWDETGCVFEINSDGSVTIVGRFDPAELLVDPVQEMVERLNNDGLIEMIPRMWTFYTVGNDAVDDSFLLAWNDDIYSVSPCPHCIDELKTNSLTIRIFEGDKSVISIILSKIADGYLTLMPCTEKEYIFSLGAKACIERAFGNKVKVRISSPAVMGAFGIAITRQSDKSSKISFAFGEEDDYMCCNLLVDEGVYEVKKLLRSSIIQPTETFTALQHIAKGSMAQSLIQEGLVTNHLLIDMLPYTISLLLKDNGRVIKIYDFISNPVSIPTRQGDNDINVDNNKTLSFLIGSNELIEDIMSQCNAPNGKVGTFIELDSNMAVTIKVTSNGNDFKIFNINVGTLIG